MNGFAGVDEIPDLFNYRTQTILLIKQEELWCVKVILTELIAGLLLNTDDKSIRLLSICPKCGRIPPMMETQG